MVAQLNDIAQIWWQWMSSMFWQVSLLILLVTVLDMAIRRWAWPQVRYALWALVFIKLIIPPTWQMPTSIISWIQPQVEKQISVQVGITDEAVKNSEPFLVQSEEKEIAQQLTWKTYLLSVWISGMVSFSLLLVKKILRFRKWRSMRVKEDIPEWFNELMKKTALKLKLKKIPIVVFSKDVKSPAVYGVVRQSLILPEGYMEKLSKEQAKHVLMHELCHLKRGDLLVHWFCILIQIVYWFNPLLIWSRRQMRNICEICCDLSVANVLREKTAAYRETILKTTRELFSENIEPSLGLLGIFEEPYRLVPRLKWLEKKSWENRKSQIGASICASFFMVFCVMPMACISQTSKYTSEEINPNQNQEKIKIAKQPQAQILYEILLMEADIDKVFDFGSPPSRVSVEQSPGLGFHGFKDGLSVDGESFKDLGELFRYMEADPDVNVLSFPKILAAIGSTATMDGSVTPKLTGGITSVPKPSMHLKITPNTISENNLITQDFEFKVIEGMTEEEPARESVKTINTTLTVKDGDTVLIVGIQYEDSSSSERIGKKIYTFLTPRIKELGQRQAPIVTEHIPVNRIMFDIRIVEASKNFSQDLGIKGPSSQVVSLSLDSTLASAESEGRAKVLSAPRIIAKEGSDATLSSGNKIPSTSNSSSAQSIPPLSLTLSPEEVSSDDSITLGINVTKNQPPSAKKSINTTVIVKSGKTVVVGGIGNENEPGNEAGATSKPELIIFITPVILPEMGS